MAESRTAAETERSNGSNGAEAGGDAGVIEVRRPANGTLIRTVEIDSAESVAAKVARVRKSQPAWEALGIEGRYRWLKKLADWLIDNDEEITDLLQEETGKVRADADAEAMYVASVIHFYGENAEEFLAEETPKPQQAFLKTKRLRVVYRPYEVVGAISPWNFPVILGLEDALAAMQAGSAAVLKPSEITPLTVNRIVEAWKMELGGPDVLEIVNGLGETGGALVDACDYVQFTGSERTGKIVMKRAADTLTPVSLELGGKDPMIVLADSDVDRAVNATAWGGLLNTGQICMSIERVYVEEPIYDEFVGKLAAKVRDEIRQGSDGRGYSAEVGAMTSPAQIDIVSSHVEDAREAGARILTGGRKREGAGDWYEPTVIADADHSMRVMREETFGPVIPVMKVADEEEAVRMANDTAYGLSASVFSGDVKRAERVARKMEVGATNINDALINYFAVEVPMGGWKTSGIGYRHGAYGIRKFMRSSAIVSPRFANTKNEPLWYPYTPGKRKLLGRVNRFFTARDWRRKLGLGRR